VETSAKSCAEVASHEIGHTLGLSHDGRVASGSQPSEEYYEGHGSGATGWAPIMGVGYYRQLTHWSRGEYARANNTQDDISIMGQSVRIPLLTDDHGSTSDMASNITGDRVEGLAERRADFDYFRVVLPAGTHSIFLQSAAHTNLDLELQIQDSAGMVIATSNPAEELAASASFTLAAPQTVLDPTPHAVGVIVASCARAPDTLSVATANSSASAPSAARGMVMNIEILGMLGIYP
jgi:hypothetical protein